MTVLERGSSVRISGSGSEIEVDLSTDFYSHPTHIVNIHIIDSIQPGPGSLSMLSLIGMEGVTISSLQSWLGSASSFYYPRISNPQ